MAYTERDLVEATLAGRIDAIPGSLRPVADTLAALRAAPSGAELAGEAVARAEFRAVMHGAGQAAHNQTLLLGPAPASRRPARRHRRRRTSRPRLAFSPVLLLGAAAAVVLVLVAGVTPIGHDPLSSLTGIGKPAASQSAGGQHAGHRASGPSVQGTGNSEASPSPATSHSAVPTQSRLADLCTQYLEFFSRQHAAAGWQKERALGSEIAKLANLTKLPAGRMAVYGYCERQLIGPTSHGSTGPQGNQGGLKGSDSNHSGTGTTGSASQSQ